ncbi:hypothetical protein FE782_22255 [Paenibacillus antri]|uniref:Uncharacterized protein n=1 Tax=Paenibacillus antri TaxID=2582848 RepID=A0A5R9G2K3_9BACL|nr:hypothetical protein [Paenibacillus antri]TLS50061.1 hypothetical protein FE782_22255 [Paenibacillus antri]
MKLWKLVGVLASGGSILLWVLFAFYNPYTHATVGNEPLVTTFFTLLLPALVALIASLIKKPSYMFVSFVWSLPISMYAAMTPSIFKLFGAISVMYLLSGMLMVMDRRS